jgi:hypothetical protein
MITDTTRPYIARMPAMTTGMHIFTIMSGLRMAVADMPMLDFAVP